MGEFDLAMIVVHPQWVPAIKRVEGEISKQAPWKQTVRREKHLNLDLDDACVSIIVAIAYKKPIDHDPSNGLEKYMAE